MLTESEYVHEEYCSCTYILINIDYSMASRSIINCILLCAYTLHHTEICEIMKQVKCQETKALKSKIRWLIASVAVSDQYTNFS